MLLRMQATHSSFSPRIAMHQQKNFIIFVVCAIVFFIVLRTLYTTFVQSPVPERPPRTLTLKEKRDVYVNTYPARLPLSMPGSGVADVGVVATELALAVPPPPPAPPPPTFTTGEKRALFVATAPARPLFLGGAGLGAAVQLAGEVALAPWAPQRPANVRVRLGSRDRNSPYHLMVLLESVGAGVRQVVLNKFQQADTQGKPQWEMGLDGKPILDEEGKPIPEPLELISPTPNGIGTSASNLLYHYDVNRPESDHPLTTLANVNWRIARVKGPKALCEQVRQAMTDPSDLIEEVTGEEGEQVVAFTAEVQDIRLTKTFSLKPKEYHVGLEVQVERQPGTPRTERKVRYQLTSGHGLRLEGEWYTNTFRQSLIGLLEEEKSVDRILQDIRYIDLRAGGDAYLAEKDKRILYAAIGVQYFASAVVVDDTQPNKDFLASVRPTLETRLVKVTVDKPPRAGDPTFEVSDKARPGQSDLYYLSPVASEKLSKVPAGTRVALLCRHRPLPLDERTNPPPVSLDVIDAMPEDQAQMLFVDDITMRVNTRPIELKADSDKPVVHKYLLYNGPIKVKLLEQMDGVRSVEEALVDRYADTLHLKTMTDYPSPGFWGSIGRFTFMSNLIMMVTNLMHWVLHQLHHVVPSYGICILLLTIMVRGIMYPVSRKQALTSLRMQELAPELKKLQEKYKDDRQAFAQAQMELFRKNGVNPFGSCWMLFLQMPIFMGLYYCLQESVHFRLAPFLWVKNLAAPDMLFSWGESIPLISTPESYGSMIYLGPYLNLLPIIAVTLMILQQKMMMPPPADEQQAMQQKMMKYMMVVMCVLFYKVAAGLGLYFIASSLWGFAERKLLPKKKAKVEGETATAEGLFQKLTGRSESASTSDVPAGATGKGGADRGSRRPDRKRRKGKDEEEATGWWADTKKKVSEWWAELQRQAERKK